MSIESEQEEVENWIEPEKPKKKRRKWKWVFIMIAIMVLQFILLGFQLIRNRLP